jgi:phosphatidylinositol glycan class X
VGWHSQKLFDGHVHRRMSWLEAILEPKHGFHRSYKTTIALSGKALAQECSLHLFYGLPPHIFVDPYELAHHANSYTFERWGTSNLELPMTAVSSEGSAVLLNVTRPKKVAEFDSLNIAVQVPMHLRYGEPYVGGYHREHVPWPKGFLACCQWAMCSVHGSSC